MHFNLKDKVALVTGSGRGIGKSIAEMLGKSSAKIVLSDIDEETLANTQKEFIDMGIEATSVKCNVADSASVKESFAKAEEKFSKIDILINNAGITRDSLLMRAKEEDWDAVMNVNLKGTMNCTKQVLRGMMKRQWGRIINISSVVGQIGNAGQANYSAAKAGMIGFTKTMAREVASRNITVNAVAPGYIKTDMTDKLSDEVKEMFLKQIPLKRMGTPEDIATAVIFLCADESSYITGQILGINGGMAM